MSARRTAISAATFLAWALPLALVVFLLMSRFFVGWSGTIASVRPYEADDAARLALIVHDDGTDEERWLPADALDGLGLPVSAIAAPPRDLPGTAPRTSKSRFTLSMFVVPASGEAHEHTTTSPSALALAAIALLVSLALRNMAASGSPLRFETRPTVLPEALPAAGQPTGPKRGPPRKTRPPARKRRR